MKTSTNLRSEHTELHSFFARLETDRSINNVKKNGTMSHRLFKSMFRTVDRIAPDSAELWGAKLFYTPRQRKLRNRDLELIEKSSIEYVQFKDESLPVYTWGNSDHPAIILIPGWGGRPTDFGNWIEPLVSEGYRVVAPEGPAHGDSKANRTSLPELAEFLHSVVQGQENIAGYIGHSLGGAIILLGFSQGLVHKPSIFINTPADPEGIIDVFLEKIEGGKHIGRYIKEKVRSDFGKEFEEFSALHTARELSAVPVMIIHDRSDTESPIFHFEAFKEVVPWSEHLVTEYLGHNRILLDEDVVQKGTAFMADNA